MKAVKDRSSLLYILLPLWLVASIGVFKAEWVSVNVLRVLLSNPDERQRLSVRPIDRLAVEAERVIPSGAKVFFFDPYPWDSPTGGFYSGRLRYQLYQRELKVISPGDEFDYRSMPPGSFAVFIWPEGPQPVERDLVGLASMVNLYSFSDARGALSVYGVGGAR